MKKSKQMGLLFCAAVYLALALAAWLVPAKADSLWERRALSQKPAASVKTVLDGSFMTKFDTAAQDQFPLRDGFRTLKALSNRYVFRQGDNNGVYLLDGYAAKLEYPYSPRSGARALEMMQKVWDTYFADGGGKAVIAVVPDKGYYLAPKGGYPEMDYAALFSEFRNQDFAAYADLTDSLSLDSYYRTDTHWRQEALLPVAERLASLLGTQVPEFTETTLDTPFYGVYRGQAALPMKPDALVLLENDSLRNCTVKNYETGETGSVYDLDKLSGRDPYDVYLSGAVSLLEITNPAGNPDRTLVIFRDSFGSSLAPLLVSDYGRVILADLRYMPGRMLQSYVGDISGADVLFLYSTLVLNSSALLKW